MRQVERKGGAVSHALGSLPDAYSSQDWKLGTQSKSPLWGAEMQCAASEGVY